MGENKLIRWLAHTPNAPLRNGWIAAAGTMPYLLAKTWQHLEQNQGDITPEILLHATPTMAAFIAAYIGTVALHTRTKKENATKPGDYKKIGEFKKLLSQAKPPEIPFSGEQRIGYKLRDMLKYYYVPFLRHSAESVERSARERKNPLLALDAAIKYGVQRKQFDKSLLLIRDALEWLNGQKPKVSLSTQIAFWHIKLALKLARKLGALEPSTYMISAAYDAIMNPERAWYWSQLGRMVADTLSTSRRSEMYVFHALLAIAQNRTDKKEAFRDAFNLLYETCTPRRLGESRHPAWIVEDEKGGGFFSGTFAFKGNESRTELEQEWKATLTLDQILEENATAPQPLYLTEEPHNGLYVYVMRYLKGELLSQQLKRGDNSGIRTVIPVLARILVRYPTEELPRVSIREKTYKKLQKIGAEHMMEAFEPVISDLESQPALAPNKDGHSDQWQMLDDPYITAKVGVLDAEIRETHPAILESANLLEYAGNFEPEERRIYISNLAEAIRREGARANKPEFTHAYAGVHKKLFRAHNNATIHRGLCLDVAWKEPGREKTPEERAHVIKNALRAIEEERREAENEDVKEKYDRLAIFFTNLLPS